MSLKAAKLEALDAFDTLLEDDVEKLVNFTASSNWIQRFKDRNELVSRRHTTTKTLPQNYADKAREFIFDVQALIKSENIQKNNIINFDQVPRYFELNINSTIIKKGTREVRLRKASSSHRRFTFTPFISASGKFIGRHFLFSKLKKIPPVANGCVADVNQTGMWSENTIKAAINNFIVHRNESLFNQPTLIILDSYGAHLKFVENNRGIYAKKNIHFKFIPPCLTGIKLKLNSMQTVIF